METLDVKIDHLNDRQLTELAHVVTREREQRRIYMGDETYQNKARAEQAQVGCDSPGPTTQHPMNRRSTAPIGQEFTLDNIDEAMAYQPWMPDQQEAGTIIREALTTAAKAILRHAPVGRYRSVALRQVLDARMNANAAISFRGRF